MKKLILLVALLVIGAIASSNAVAVTIVPTGLNPGDQYRLAFVTSTTRDATSIDIVDYNAFVTTAAALNPDLAGLGPWSAIASTMATDARDNTETNPLSDASVPIYRLDDILIAATYLELWDGSIDSELWIDEGGVKIVGEAWTGTAQNGTNDVNGRALGESFASVTGGTWRTTNGDWIENNVRSATDAEHLYAISTVLHAPIPEPATIALLGIGLVGLAGAEVRRRRKKKAVVDNS